MSIGSRRALEVTRGKLKLLEARLAAVRKDPAENRRQDGAYRDGDQHECQQYAIPSPREEAPPERW